MKLKKLILLFVSIVLILNVISIKDVNAEGNMLENLEIDVFIKENGSAVIKEKRVANLTEGTENYIVINNLGKSTIKDFKVKENGREYEFLSDWDIDSSKEEKAFKNGIVDTENGYELCWGIGEYGRHEYTLEYTVTDFIKELDDSQILFWRFLNDQTNIPPQKVSLSIRSDKMFNAEDQKVWGFGFEGDVEFSEGRVVAQSSVALSSENYVTILLKLEKGMFLTGDYVNKTFEEIKEEAFEGSDYGGNYEGDYSNDYGGEGHYTEHYDGSGIFGIFGFIFVVITGVIFIGLFKGISEIGPGVFKRKFKEEYYRDYPYEGDVADIYYILYKMGLASFNNMLTGFLLKWMHEDKLITVSEEVGLVIKKEKTNIKIINSDLPQETLERELFNMIISASKGNQILEEKEFTNWARKNYGDIDLWEKKAKEESIKKLESLRYLESKEVKKLFFTKKEYKLTDRGLEVEENIYKYINYLYDYSLLNEHEAVNVKIWDNIMIWAGFLGITEVVSKQFEKIYPKYMEETIYRGNSIYLATALTQNVSNARISTSSSGFGGSTSIGGGGGSFGGGSGGGTR